MKRDYIMSILTSMELKNELMQAAQNTPIILKSLYNGQHSPTNAAEVLLYPYPERLRLLILCGSKISESSSDYEVFASACKLMPYLSGTSAYAEMQRDVNLMLNEDVALNEENCDLVWKMIARMLMKDSADLLSRLNIKKLVASPRFDRICNITDALCVPDLTPLVSTSVHKLKKALAVLGSSADLAVTSLATLENAFANMIRSVHSQGVNTVSLEIRIDDFRIPNPYSAEQALKTVLFGKSSDVNEEERSILRFQILRTVCKILCAEGMRLALRVTSDKSAYNYDSVPTMLEYLNASDLLPRVNLIISPEMMMHLANTASFLIPALLTADLSFRVGYRQVLDTLRSLSAVLPLSRISAPILSSMAQISILREALCRVLTDATEEGSAPNDAATLASVIDAFCYRNCSDFYSS